MRSEPAAEVAAAPVDTMNSGGWFRYSPEGPDVGAADAALESPARPRFVDSVWGTTAGQGHTWFQDLPPAAPSTTLAGSTVGRALHRLFRTYVAARAVVGGLLALLHLGSSLAGALPPPGALWVTSLYAAQVLAVVVWQLIGSPAPQLKAPGRGLIALTVGVDAIAFVVLLALESGASFNFGALLVLPVLMAGVVMPRRQALATAAAVTLALLAQAWWNALQIPSGPSPWLTSGLAGIGLFAIAWLSGELASRLLREERVAMDSQERARQQARLNRLVIEEMGEGVLVLNRQRRLLAANPAAQALLGLPAPVASHDAWPVPVEPWAPLLDVVERAYEQGDWPVAGREVAWRFEGQSSSPAFNPAPMRLRVRVRFTRADSGPDFGGQAQELEDLCVLLLEDERTVQSRIQQEKLAAMGRVSAGIAHEIRNPLAAIAQANELLAEDRLPRAQGQLVSIISDNVHRLRRLVEDVLEALPAGGTQARSIEAVALLRSVVTDWCRTARVEPSVLALSVPADEMQVLFDPEHLRRVLVNLLENAVRHCTGRPGAVQIVLGAISEQEAVLEVTNDGPAVPPEVEIHMFEPFFSTRSRGSGLGLYICKELCERHGAAIRLEHRPFPQPHRTVFMISLRRPVSSGRVEGPG